MKTIKNFCLLYLLSLFVVIGCSKGDDIGPIATEDTFTVERAGGEITVSVNLSGDIKASYPFWIEESNIESSSDKKLYKYYVAANWTGKDRSGKITFRSGSSSFVATVTQEGEGVYKPSEDLSGVEISAKQVIPTGGKASDERPSAPFKRVWMVILKMFITQTMVEKRLFFLLI